MSPLVIWSSPDAGPYTWPADIGSRVGMKMSVVSMPPAYSKNIALWAAIGHEVGGHDVLHADNGLLTELSDIVSKKLLERKNDPKLKEPVIVNGRKQDSVAEFAAGYWKKTMDETASDVCGILNLGPAAGIGIAALLIPIRGGKLVNALGSQDVHPIDALRIFLAADVIRGIKELDVKVAAEYADTLESIVDNYITSKDDFGLFSNTFGGVHWDVLMPYEGMRETVNVVAETIAFTNLETLENHHLSEINTWANQDEILTQRIMEELIDGKEPSLEPGPDGQTVYAAHVLSGGIMALTKSVDISRISDLTIDSLVKLYDNNPVWRGFPVRFRSDADVHNMVPSYKQNIPSHEAMPSAHEVHLNLMITILSLEKENQN